MVRFMPIISENRANLVVNHVAGSKSFIRHRREMQNPETGEERGEIDHYKDVHYREQKGTWVHPLALERWETMQLKRSQPTPDGAQRSELEIMSDVLGNKSGYVRGLGHGAKFMAPSRSNRVVMEAELKKRAEENQRLQLQIEELRDEIRESRAVMDEEITKRTRDELMESRVAMEAEITRRTDEIRVQQETQMQEMFQSLMAQLQLPRSSTTPP
ncbi:hypothetical protein QJS10_CPB14g01058 [Acorus calamus]|uniref:Uncharacterized protein n=1 Tax=Acorus calamus TaxID=4465 RepID=A0AAV9DGY1_ACOCL|nr:hypothetical protein QJS10_CPB14g01058 [Acorus calamus]